MSENHYDELGVDADASRDELRTAYRDRVSELEARREGKGVNEAQLEANREEMARVRSAWNVLSDPFQRQRYDASLSDPDAGEGTEVELVDDAADSGTQLTGWRRLLAPAPPRPASSGGDQADNRRTPPPRAGRGRSRR